MPRVFTVPSILPGLVEDIDIFKIKQPEKLLRQANNIEELANSIRKQGLLAPIIVRIRPSNEENSFEIVAGVRRYLACRSLGWKRITCHVLELDDREAFEISIVENIQRNTLSPIEEAEAFRRYVIDFGWGGVSELARKVGKSTSYVTKRIKLLNLPTDVLQGIINSSISVSTAEELSSLKDPSKQSQLSTLISRRHLSLRKVRELVKDMGENAPFERQHKEEEDIFLPATYVDDSLADVQRAFDKSIITLKIALSRLATIIDECDDSSIVHEMLMHHKGVLHEQIGLLLKEKKKARNRYVD